MRLSHQWLQRYVQIDMSAEELAERLTFLGLNVDAVDPLCPQLLDKIVMAYIEKVEEMPEGNLFKCTADAGRAGQLTVVSAAPNCRSGVYMPLALTGAELPDGSCVQRQSFGDVLSEGMLCSASELGLELGADDRLIELEESESGAPVKEALGLDDKIFELDLTPNYAAHCQSVLGVARELEAALECEVRISDPVYEVAGEALCVHDAVEVEVAAEELCPRYSAGVMTDVEIGPSSWPLQRDLIASGLRPINNVVDATNWVMLEQGQPLHAFDMDQVTERKLVVRRARDNEQIETLDGEEHKLQQDDLVIADAYRAIGIAGVMGGLNSEVDSDTDQILIESAYFDSRSILRTSRRLQKRTDASMRFEKGRDPQGTVQPLHRVMQILSDGGWGKSTRGIIDVYPQKISRRRLTLNSERVNDLLGTALDMDCMKDYLVRLGFEVQESNSTVDVLVPTWRPDIEGEVGLVEEIARLHGYNEIPSDEPQTAVSGYVPPRDEQVRERLRKFLSGVGFYEMLTDSWLAPQMLEALRVPDEHPHRRLAEVQNPMRREQKYLRTTLVASALEILENNQTSEQFQSVRFFEWAPVYIPEHIPVDSQPQEKQRLVLAASGYQTASSWHESEPEEVDFFYIKGVIDGLMRALHIDDWKVQQSRAYFLHPGRAAEIFVGEESVGCFGELHPEIAEEMGFAQRVCIAELNADIVSKVASLVPKFDQLPSYPASIRDMALVVDVDLTYQKLVKAMREAGGELLESIDLFDVYAGEQVPEGKKSVAYRLTYRATDRTLTDDEVQDYQQHIVTALQEEFSAELRS